jgi:EAL domain-containing protein (putative c-di-GMP-specific phosphodiesterase class I)
MGQIVSIFNSLYYNISVEVAFVIISTILFITMERMRPRHTPYYIYVKTGILLTIILHIANILLAFASQFANEYVYGITCLKFLAICSIVLFTCIAQNILLYVIFLSPQRRLKRKSVERVAHIITAMYCGFYAVQVVFSPYMLQPITTNTGTIYNLSPYLRININTGFIVTILSAITIIVQWKNIARMIRRNIMGYLPMELIILILQATQQRAIFVSIAEIIPLTALYLFFHSNPFDDILGCQNTYSMEVRFNDNIKQKKSFYVGIVSIPTVSRKFMAGASASKELKPIVDYCRTVEDKYENLVFYKKNEGFYYLIFEEPYGKESLEKLDMMGKLATTKIAEVGPMIKSFIMIVPYDKRIKNIEMMNYIINKLVEEKSENLGECKYVAAPEELDKYLNQYKIDNKLSKLRDKNDPLNENVLCYAQPIYEVKSGSFRTAEALMRLQFDGEMIPPDVFIPIAEQNNTVHFLTTCMIHKVCRAIKNMQDEYSFDAISVNCSVYEFSVQGFAEEFKKIIESYEIDPTKIRLELTESAIENNNEYLTINMNELAEYGIKFYLDDFGTGYSSLERIINLPFSTVKFDKSLLYGSINNDRTNHLVSGMIPLFKHDGFTALVEGVEDEEQNDYSIANGFEYIQGYKYAKPVPIEELTDYFRKKV